MNLYVQKFAPLQKGKIEDFFAQKNADFESLQYAFFKAKLSGYNAVFYESGKFVIQGKDIEGVVSEFEEFMGISSSQTASEQVGTETSAAEYSCYIGTDESGKGDYFGPLVIAGVMVEEKNKEDFIKMGIKDSKKLNDTTIKKFAAHIKNNSIFSISPFEKRIK